MRLRSSSLLCLIATALTTACGAQVLDVGSTGGPLQDRNGDGTGSATPLPARPQDTAWFPNTACVAVGPSVTLVAEATANQAIRGLAPAGDKIYFETHEMFAQSALGELMVAPIGGSASAAPVQLPSDSVRSLAGVFDGKVVYVRTTHLGDGSKLDPRVEEVVVLDVGSGGATVLSNPAGTTYVSAVDVTATGVSWLSRAWDSTFPESISHWRPSAAAALTTIQNHSFTTTDDKEVFYTRWDEQGAGNIQIRFEAVPVAGGAPRVLRTMTYDKKFHYGIVAVDDAEVYFTQQSLIDGSTIDVGDLRAIKKDGSGERILTSGQKFGVASFRIDPDYLMWTDGDSQRTIVRVRRTGGALERIVPGAPNRSVDALAVDRCNIYWAVTNPAAIYARSRLP